MIVQLGMCKFCVKRKISFIYEIKWNKNLLKPKDVLQKILRKILWNIVGVPDKICPFSSIFHRMDKSKWNSVNI